ncbi:GerAB/ArcD/ProY family transporter [Desulfosporosinus youngiae]|uniref:Spore germination protein, amino acid permease n=1 Tax=Desulfosporosinus youngiae DSM 17734 TaxID=768710 RepID=H5XWJ0_9FIRM|nr:endospore germination permease [Desulfosporosinus youngiae]EHQ90498.1 spore germination protein, amino acid permease [Desulfosporosinus youngiae DSM 17734]
MNKEMITHKQGVYLLILFMIGSNLFMGLAPGAKSDAWIAVIVGMTMAVPMIFIYARLLSLFKGMDIFDILKMVFGNVLGKIAALVYIWYPLHLGAMVIRNLGEFMNTVAIPDTPMLLPMLFVGFLCIWVVMAGVELLGRCSKVFFPIVIIIMLITTLLVIPYLNFAYLKPVMYDGISPVLNSGFNIFSFPLAETVLFLAVFSALKTDKSIYRVYFSGLFIFGAIGVLLTLRNLLVLGGDIVGEIYFPLYVEVGRISIGEFIQRIEVSVATTFIITAFIKVSVCLYVTCIGISKLFGLKSYRSVVVQTGLLMVFFAYIIYENIMDMVFFASLYPYYALPFQVILPVILLVIAEIRVRTGQLQTGRRY